MSDYLDRDDWEEEDEEHYEEEEIDEKDRQDRINDYYEETGAYSENLARSHKEGWFYPDSEGSWEDNYVRDE